MLDGAKSATGWDGADLDGALNFSYSFSAATASSRFCLFFFCLRIQKKINPAIMPTPRRTPIAIPAFAPPERPAELDAVAEGLAEAVEEEAWSNALVVVEGEDVEEAVERVVVAEDWLEVVDELVDEVLDELSELVELAELADVVVG